MIAEQVLEALEGRVLVIVVLDKQQLPTGAAVLWQLLRIARGLCNTNC